MSSKSTIPCANCKKPMNIARGSLPEGLGVCQPCRRARRGPRRPNGTLKCAVCEQPMWKGVQGKSICLPCRRKPKPTTPPKLCAKCGVEIPRRRRYCDACRDEVRGGSWSRRTITPAAVQRQRQYRSPEHHAARAKVLALVESGEAFCWRCGQHIPPGSPVHTGHDDEDRSLYRGAECPSCNVKAGASKGAKVANAARRSLLRDLAASADQSAATCEGCAEEYQRTWPNQQFCTKACLQDLQDAKRIYREYLKSLPKKCAACNASLPDRRRRYCAKCATRRPRYVPVEPRPHLCVWCGCEFMATHNPKYCGKTCSRRAFKNSPKGRAGKRKYNQSEKAREYRRKWKRMQRNTPGG